MHIGWPPANESRNTLLDQVSSFTTFSPCTLVAPVNPNSPLSAATASSLEIRLTASATCLRVALNPGSIRGLAVRR